MILSSSTYNKHQQYLAQLPKISQPVSGVEFFYTPSHFKKTLLEEIANAKQRIRIVVLYLEQDEGGGIVLNALYNAKRQRPKLDIRVLVDWHRARRNRIGSLSSNITNADWYYHIAQENNDVDVPVYGVPVNILEALGVLHFKGFIIDDNVLYTGASLNDLYLHQLDKYRYDRYHLIRNKKMADIMFNWIEQYLIQGRGVKRLNYNNPKNFKFNNNIRLYRQELRMASYHFYGDASNEQLSVIPLVGLGKSSSLNKAIFHLIPCTQHKITICTPYFNFPSILTRNIIQLLRDGKKVEIIVGDKTANDFFISENEKFNIVGVLPYLYEINLRRFLNRLRYYVNLGQLIVRLWKDDRNSYHLKGTWVDEEWILLTGNNLNLRAWKLDLENAILIHDPKHELSDLREKELEAIRIHTHVIYHYYDLQNIADYPSNIKKLIRCFRRIWIDRLISCIL